MNDMFSEYKHLIEAHLDNESMTSSFAYIEWLKAFEKIISFVAGYDPDGQTLRYPTKLSGAPNIEKTSSVNTDDVLCLIKYIKSYYHEYYDRTV